MGAVHVISPGFLTTVQDRGRYGFSHLGISASGCADEIALRVGNRLVGNDENEAGLEMTLIGGTFECESEETCTVTGGDFDMRLNDRPMGMWSAIRVPPKGRITIGQAKKGARCYLCFQGGLDLQPTLGSRSTHLVSGMGGFEGRALLAGDTLRVNSAKRNPAVKSLQPEALARLYPDRPLRITPGPQAGFFGEQGLEVLCSSPYEVTEASDRMGLRLAGAPIELNVLREMLTEGVSLGAVQILPDGQPILVFVEHQTTGGYPKIANLIEADIHRVGQLRPRDRIRFELVSYSEAAQLLRRREREVHRSLGASPRE